MSRATANVAAAIWLLSVSVIAAVALLILVIGCAGTVREVLAFTFPARDRWLDVATILLRNSGLAATALALARNGAGVAVAILSMGWSVNVCVAGAALGAYGDRLVEHAVVYGLLELGAFSLVLAICLRLIQSGDQARGGEVFVLGALLIVAALTETLLAWPL